MRHLSRYFAVTVLACAVAGCRGGDKAPLTSEQAAGSAQQAPAAPQQSVPEAPAARPTAPPEPVPTGPAPDVMVNGVRTNGDAAVIADFQKRIAAYQDLKKGADDRKTDQKETKDPEHIEAKQKLLASKIIALRQSARAGDIFAPEIRTKFRQLLMPPVKGTTGRETKQELNEDFEEGGKEAGNPKAALKVNVEYPEGTPLATTPPNVLQALPHLPEGLEYRFVGKNLLLRDADANIVVDLMPNAIR